MIRGLVLTLRRDGSQQTVSYTPRGAPVEGHRWARNPTAPASACHF